MGIIRDKRTGIYHARKKVPEGLEETTAQVLRHDKSRLSWLTRTLGTKDKRQANVLGKPVLAEFDRVLARAAALIAARPVQSQLSDRDISRIAAYHFASKLAEDDDIRRNGTGSEAVFHNIARQLQELGVPAVSPFDIRDVPTFGLSDREMSKIGDALGGALDGAKHALARGDISAVGEEVSELLDVFEINLDPSSEAYRKLAYAVLKQDVAALQELVERHKGEPVETPMLIEPTPMSPALCSGETLTAAFAGWKKFKERTPSTVSEYTNAINRFVELHGDMTISAIRRDHVRRFREALQSMPVRRSGPLRTANLPEIVAWAEQHPEAPRVSSATVNKLLGGVQAISVWGRDNGLVPDEVPWADPFTNMRLKEDEPHREPWTFDELHQLFASPVFASGVRPRAGGGGAAYWLPLLGLFTGCRLGELAPLTASDVVTDGATGIVAVEIDEDVERGVRVKTKASRRTVPLHPKLLELGFLGLVEARRRSDGPDAMLFPLLSQGQRGGYGENWSKWFGRYIRSIGVTNPDRVFHSFRHTFRDELGKGGVDEELKDALMGHSGSSSVGRRYGAKSMLRRFGLPRLQDAVASARYSSLDLSSLCRNTEDLTGPIGGGRRRSMSMD